MSRRQGARETLSTDRAACGAPGKRWLGPDRTASGVSSRWSGWLQGMSAALLVPAVILLIVVHHLTGDHARVLEALHIAIFVGVSLCFLDAVLYRPHLHDVEALGGRKQDCVLRIPNRSGIESRCATGDAKLHWENPGFLGIVVGALSALGVRWVWMADEAPEPPAPARWPAVATLLGDQVRLRRAEGGSAYFDPWRNEVVLGCQWTLDNWTTYRILAHERGHAEQPRWRTRLADAGRFVIVAGVFGIGGLAAPSLEAAATVGMAVLLWEACWHWPLERDANETACRRLLAAMPDGSPRLRQSVDRWMHSIQTRHRIANILEGLGWACATAAMTYVVFLLR